MSAAGWVVFVAREFGLRHRYTESVPVTVVTGAEWVRAHPAVTR